MRLQLAPDIVVYQSDLLASAGIRHAFSTRFDRSGHDQRADPVDIPFAESVDRLCKLLAGSDEGRPCFVHQIHGCAVDIPDDRSEVRPENLKDRSLAATTHRNQADAIATGIPGHIPTIITADCVPILLAAPSIAVAAVHAGWRGLVAGVIERAVDTLVMRFAAERDTILAAVGPSICPDHYEVGQEVADAFINADLSQAVLPAQPPLQPNPQPHLDLRSAATNLLMRAGLAAHHIEVLDLCTFCLEDDFHSYRRDGSQAGRQASMIVR